MNSQNHNGNLTDKEIEWLEENAWLPFDTEGKLHYKKYASDILNYRPLFGKELNSTKILMLIKLWENKTREGTYHTLEVLARAAGIDSTYASVMISQMCESKLSCFLCGQEFGILEIIGSHIYETKKEGNLYNLDKIESLLKHITKEHYDPNPDLFYKKIKEIEKQPKAKNSQKQIDNLIWKKEDDF